jgi:DNA-binding SARP family transcriptional activator/tRNA A-37 threonylcarbamoyl transferase component Bud32
VSFKLFTLGTLRLAKNDTTVSGPACQRRRLALLTLLATAGARGMTRDKVIGLLWPEQSTSGARKLLSEAVYVLGKLLGKDAIVATSDHLKLNPEAIWCDVVAFRNSLESDVAAAVDLYHGPFLDGFYLSNASEFEQWIDGERAQIAREFAHAVEQLAQKAAEQRDYVHAATLWERLAHHEPFSSRVAARYMESLAAAGDRARAVQFATTFAKRMHDELGMAPDAEITRLAETLKTTTPQSAAVPAQKVALHVDNSHGLAQLAPEFDVLRSIGAGSVAEVFLARETALKRLVAIKVLRREYAVDEHFRKRFEREAQSAARIEHPNVATAFRFGRLSDGMPFIVMPYIGGGSLEDRMAGSGPWMLPRCKAQLAQIASGLAAAHKLGIVHRDVRPGNILYQRDSDRALLIDFGLAAVLESGDAASLRLTLPGEQLGNPAYASPQQLQGENVTERADVYSLGVIAFEMVSGELPFTAKTYAETLLAHATEPPRALTEVAPGIDKGFAALVARCLNKRAELRPFAAELAEVLR